MICDSLNWSYLEANEKYEFFLWSMDIINDDVFYFGWVPCSV